MRIWQQANPTDMKPDARNKFVFFQFGVWLGGMLLRLHIFAGSMLVEAGNQSVPSSSTRCSGAKGLGLTLTLTHTHTHTHTHANVYFRQTYFSLGLRFVGMLFGTNAPPQAMKAMYDAGGDMCQKEAKQVKCPTLILSRAQNGETRASLRGRYRKTRGSACLCWEREGNRATSIEAPC